MTLRWIIVVLILLSIFPSSLIELSRARPIEITVAQSTVTMNMNLVLQENLTSLPSINIYLTEANSSTVLQPITTAIDKLVPNASVASLELRAKTSNSSAMWLLEENYSITVKGASTNLGSNIRTNIGFIAMNVSQSLMVSNQELNAVGSAYLLAPLNAQDPRATTYYIDGHRTLSSVIPAQTTTTFWLLDLTWVSPISTWTKNDDVLKQSTIWSLDLGAPRYNLTYGTRSPEGGLLRVNTAIYNPTFSVSVPANAWADGSTISFDVPSPFEIAMPAIAAVSLVAVIAGLVLDRRLTRVLRTRKKKR
jgi:hypothetical protein